MKKVLGIILTLGLLMSVSTNTAKAGKNECATIKDGTIVDSVGNVIKPGFDEYGYNYGAHMFNGFYGNYSRPAVPVTEGDRLVMKWSDPWLANVDCDGDGYLDRGLTDYNVAPTGTSMGWLTNHYYGDGVVDFVKIVWTGPESPLWGEYTIVQEVWNEPSADLHGLYLKEGTPGFGLNDHWTTN